ncbi:MAG: hypothetical protein ACXQS2_04565, partial [Methermicoccaceae archaeon]
MYIGDVFIPAITRFDDIQGQKVIQFRALGYDYPVVVSFKKDLQEVELEAALYPSGSKTAREYAEDIRALLRDPAYNWVDYAGRVGYLVVEEVSTPEGHGLVQEAILRGRYLPTPIYKRYLKSNPVIETNDFSLALGSDGCDCYVPLPIGYTYYSGGDGSTITRACADGTITLVKATTSNQIDFDFDGDEVNCGECKLYDTGGSSTETDWKRVFSTQHTFSDPTLISDYPQIDNGLIKMPTGVELTTDHHIKVYDGSSWNTRALMYVYGMSSPTVWHNLTASEVTPDRINVTAELNSTSIVKGRISFEMLRGIPLVKITFDRTGGSLAPSYPYHGILWRTCKSGFAYIPESTPLLKDNFVESNTNTEYTTTLADNYIATITRDNYIMLCARAEKSICVRYYNDPFLSVGMKYPSIDSTATGWFGAWKPSFDIYLEAEDGTITGSTAQVTGAYPSGQNNAVQLDAQYERVYHVWQTSLPSDMQGTYRVFVRAKDSNQVSDDFRAYVYNDTDGVQIASNYFTLKSTFD